MLQYKACEKSLMKEMGLPPSEETYSFVHKVGSNDGKLKHIDFMASDVPVISRTTLEREIGAGKTGVLLVLSFTDKNYCEVNKTLELIQVSLRQGDLISRWTETSIAVLLASTDYTGALRVSKRLKQTLLKWIPGCKIEFEILDSGKSKQWLMKTAIDGSITQ
jgi:hypothetical protein